MNGNEALLDGAIKDVQKARADDRDVSKVLQSEVMGTGKLVIPVRLFYLTFLD